IAAAIEPHPFSIETETRVPDHYRRLALRSCMPAVPVAGRSSATAEDLAGASFAGQQDTYLWVRGIDEVLQHMRRCIASLYSARAIAYRANKGVADEGLAIAVGGQKMAHPFTAGDSVPSHPRQ